MWRLKFRKTLILQCSFLSIWQSLVWALIPVFKFIKLTLKLEFILQIGHDASCTAWKQLCSQRCPCCDQKQQQPPMQKKLLSLHNKQQPPMEKGTLETATKGSRCLWIRSPNLDFFRKRLSHRHRWCRITLHVCAKYSHRHKSAGAAASNSSNSVRSTKTLRSASIVVFKLY